jgi:hypothetical protein
MPLQVRQHTALLPRQGRGARNIQENQRQNRAGLALHQITPKVTR